MSEDVEIVHNRLENEDPHTQVTEELQRRVYEVLTTLGVHWGFSGGLTNTLYLGTTDVSYEGVLKMCEALIEEVHGLRPNLPKIPFDAVYCGVRPIGGADTLYVKFRYNLMRYNPETQKYEVDVRLTHKGKTNEPA